MIQSTDPYDRTVAAIYRTVGDARQWPEALAAACSLVGAGSAALYTQGLKTDDGGLWALHNIGETEIARYQDVYQRFDILLHSALRRGIPDGRVFSDQTLVSRDILERTEFFNEFWYSFDAAHLIGSGTALQWNGLAPLIQLNCFRDRKQGSFLPESERMLARLNGHIFQALVLRNNLEDGTSVRPGPDFVRNIHVPALLIDANFRVIAANEGAECLLARGTFLQSERGQLVTTLVNAGLFALIARLRSDAHAAAAKFTIARDPATAQTCTYNVMPIGLDWPDFRKVDHFLISMQVMGSGEPVAWQDVALRYRLTQAELVVCRLIVEGYTLSEIAEELTRSIETVRTHAKRIMQKTGCRRQVELAREILMNFTLPRHPEEGH